MLQYYIDIQSAYEMKFLCIKFKIFFESTFSVPTLLTRLSLSNRAKNYLFYMKCHIAIGKRQRQPPIKPISRQSIPAILQRLQ